jgi:hypothetical protein
MMIGNCSFPRIFVESKVAKRAFVYSSKKDDPSRKRLVEFGMATDMQQLCIPLFMCVLSSLLFVSPCPQHLS